MIKGVLFDFNGTLFFDTFIHIASWTKYAKEKFNIELTSEDFLTNIHGRSNFYIIPYLTKNRITDKEEIDECVREKVKIYQDMVRELIGKIDLVEGTYQLFDFLNKHNIPFTIVTSSRSFNVDFYYKTFPLAKYLPREKVVCDIGKLKGKPAPDFYLEGAKVIGVDIKDCIILEDSYSGLLSAINAEPYEVIGIDNNENKEELEKVKLNHIYKNMFEVLDYIKKENHIDE